MTRYLPIFKVWDSRYSNMISKRDLFSIDYKHQTITTRERFTGKKWTIPLHLVELLPLTGYRDKSGREVYVADVLKWTPTEGQRLDGKTEIYSEVVYNDGRFMLKSVEGEGQDMLMTLSEDMSQADKMEVVGNIYEKPELRPLVDKEEYGA